MRNCPRCGRVVEEAVCDNCGMANPAFVDASEVRSGLEIDEEAKHRHSSDEVSRPYFGGGVIANLPRDPLADVPPWRREIGVITWEAAIVFLAWIVLADGNDRFLRGGIAAGALAISLLLGARIFFFLRDGEWLPGAKSLAKASALRGALAPLTWPIGLVTFPFALLATAHEAAFVTAPWLFGRFALAGVVLATAGIAALLATR